MVSVPELRQLLAVYEEWCALWTRASLTRAAAAKAPRAGAGGKLVVIGLGQGGCGRWRKGLRAAGEAVLVLPGDAPEPPGARVFRGSHPLPDAASLRAERLCSRQRGRCGRRRRCSCLISGGGSALAERRIPISRWTTCAR